MAMVEASATETDVQQLAAGEACLRLEAVSERVGQVEWRAARQYAVTSPDGKTRYAEGLFCLSTVDGVTRPSIDLADDEGVEELPADSNVVDLVAHVTLWPPSAYLAELEDVASVLEEPVYDADGNLASIERQVTRALVPRGLLEQPRGPDAPPFGLD